MTSSFRNRLLSAVFGGGLIIGLLVMKDMYIIIPAFLLAMIGVYEFHRVFKDTYAPMPKLGMALAAFTMLAYLTYTPSTSVYWLMGGLVVFYSLLIYHLFTDHQIIDVMISLFSVVYVVLPFIMIMGLAKLDAPYIWLVFLIAFSADTFGYLVGKAFGKRKLIEHISPKKTVEGALGGVTGAVLVTVIFAVFFMPSLPLISLVILGVVGAVSSILGDLTASKVKRLCQVKDYGHLIPGHGGVLDRFDSILFTAPVVFLFAWLMTIIEVL